MYYLIETAISKFKKFEGFLWYLVTYLGFLLWCNILTQAIRKWKWLPPIDAVATKMQGNSIRCIIKCEMYYLPWNLLFQKTSYFNILNLEDSRLVNLLKSFCLKIYEICHLGICKVCLKLKNSIFRIFCCYNVQIIVNP